MLDIAQVKQAASSMWPEILSRLTGVLPELLDCKHHPCPKCGGKDRFRMIDRDTGSLFCNQCFSKNNGDGLAAVMWLTDLPFQDALAKVADLCGIKATTREVDVIQEMAWRKNIKPESLKAFGADYGKRGDLTTCRVPMRNADYETVGHLDLAPLGEFDKGKMTQGSRHGMFMAIEPTPGRRVAIVEGVKDASALMEIGVEAVGLPTCRMDAAFARAFRGCHVVIIPDRDKAGLEGAEETAGRLFGVAASVKIAELPAEFKETGGADVRDVLRTRDGKQKVLDVIDHARNWESGDAKDEAPKLILFYDVVGQMIDGLGEDTRLLTTGLPEVDFALGGGVLPGEVVIIAGRPSHGKSVVGMQALDGLALDTPCLMISEEMSGTALASRALLGITGIQETEWHKDKSALHQAAMRHFQHRKGMYLSESCGSVKRAVDAIAEAKEKYGIGAVCIDYIQLLEGKGKSPYEKTTDVSKKLKKAAVKHDVVLLALCQLNRATETRNSSCPRMSDLRDSGQLEQDADVILFVEWPHRTSPDKHLPTDYRIVIGKNRNRKTMKSLIECVFIAEKQRLFVKDHREVATYVAPAGGYGEFDGYSGGGEDF